jgi:hypothetical protein
MWEAEGGAGRGRRVGMRDREGGEGEGHRRQEPNSAEGEGEMRKWVTKTRWKGMRPDRRRRRRMGLKLKCDTVQKQRNVG